MNTGQGKDKVPIIAPGKSTVCDWPKAAENLYSSDDEPAVSVIVLRVTCSGTYGPEMRFRAKKRIEKNVNFLELNTRHDFILASRTSLYCQSALKLFSQHSR